MSKGHECRVILHQSEIYRIKTPYIYEGVEVFGATGMVDAYRWADIILTHLDFTQFTIIMAASARRPIVHLVHNDITYSSIMNGYGNNAVVYNSKWVADVLRYPHPSIVLPPPCDAKDYKVDNEGADAITLISLNENKGADIFYQIAEAMPEQKFIGVVGSYDEQIIRHLPNVEIVPNSPDILATYRRTKILLMPSAYESWGRTATEAMCSGIPVICTPTPGLKENCGNAAYYVGKELQIREPGKPAVDRGSVSDWINAIKYVLENYEKYCVLSTNRAAELNPSADLEKLEQFLMKQAYEK